MRNIKIEDILVKTYVRVRVARTMSTFGLILCVAYNEIFEK